MEKITSSINLLESVLSTMDTISVTGLENQSRFVGCGEAIQTVSKTLGKFLQESAAVKEEKEEEDGR